MRRADDACGSPFARSDHLLIPATSRLRFWRQQLLLLCAGPYLLGAGVLSFMGQRSLTGQRQHSGLRALHNIFDMLNADISAEEQKKVARGILDGSYKSPYLKLLNPTRDVQRTLSTAGFDMFLEIHNKAKAAINSFTQP